MLLLKTKGYNLFWSIELLSDLSPKSIDGKLTLKTWMPQMSTSLQFLISIPVAAFERISSRKKAKIQFESKKKKIRVNILFLSLAPT